MITLPLNLKQKRVAFGAVAVLILMFLCPPWNEQSQSQMYHKDSSWGLRGSSDRTHAMGLPLFHESFYGYHWLFNAPRGKSYYDEETGSIRTYKGTSYGYHIAWGILFLQWLLVSLVALALVHRYRDNKIQVTPETMTTAAVDKPNQRENLCPHVSPEVITLKPEIELPVGKDIILAKPYIYNPNDNATNRIVTIFSFIAGVIILLGIIIAVTPDKPPITRLTPANSEDLKQEMEQWWRDHGVKLPKDDYEVWKNDFEKKFPDLIERTGIALIEKGDYQQAITEFNKLIELNPLEHEAYNNRGEAYLKLGKNQQAREDFNRAIIAINHGHTPSPEGFAGLAEILHLPEDSLQAKYYRNRGLAYEKLGNKNQAIADLKIAARGGDKEAQKNLLSKEMNW